MTQIANQVNDQHGWQPRQQQFVTNVDMDKMATKKPNPVHHVAIYAEQPSARIPLVRLMQDHGYSLSIAASVAELETMLISKPVDVILIDTEQASNQSIICPIALCASLRSDHPIPIMIISPSWSEEECVACLDNGADEYLAKPVPRSALMARVRALLRRFRGLPNHENKASRSITHQIFEFGGWQYRANNLELTCPVGEAHVLTAAEHDLLLAFLHNPQRVIARERLLEIARARMAHSSDRSVDVLVSRLRRKLGDKQARRPLIKTARGQGYMLSAAVSFY